MNLLGNHSTSWGNNVIATNTPTSTIKKTIESRAIFIIGTSDMADTIKRLSPTGGVSSPIIKLSVMTTPKWIGSIPSLINGGKKIGTVKRIIGTGSITHPIINNAALIMKRIT
jgi:hypothetical protein